jgi:hypothetical protein
VLEPGLFPNRLRQLVEAVLTSRLANVAAVLLPRSSDPDYKCFLYLRELARLGAVAARPPVLLFDLLHADFSGALGYNADRARTLSGQLAALARRPHGTEEVRRSIVSANGARAAARRLHALRARPPRVGGVEALSLLGAFWQLDPERYASLANAAAECIVRRAPLEGVRVLVAGAPVDGTALHAAIEAEGAVVVAELSPFGAVGVDADVESAGDPFAALAKHYAHGSIDARLPVERLMRRLDELLVAVDAVVISLPPDDASFGWDYPRARELLGRHSLPHTVVAGDHASGVTAADRERIASLLRTARARKETDRG